MSTTGTDGLSTVQILELCVLELRGLREDLNEEGLLAYEAEQRPAFTLIKGGEEGDDA